MAAVLGGFAAVAAVNTLVMTVLDRRRELGTLRLIGSTRRQVLRMVRWEACWSPRGRRPRHGHRPGHAGPDDRGLTGDGPYMPPLVYGAFVAAAVALGLLAVTLPGRAALRDREGGS